MILEERDKKYIGKSEYGSYMYEYTSVGGERRIVHTSESPKEYESKKKLAEHEKMLSVIPIYHKGKKFNELILNEIREELRKNHVPKHNYLNDDNFDANRELSKAQLEDINKWRKNMKASSWKSRQRSLRKKGELEQYKIDMLNKMGMIWNFENDGGWEKNYKIFKKYNLCYDNEEWVNEQRKLYNNNELSNENLFRLQAVDFSFDRKDDEKYPYTWDSLNMLEEKLLKKQKRVEKIINDPKQKKKPIKKFINKKSRKPKSKWAILHSKYVSITGKFNKNLQSISLKDAIELIKRIEKGESMYKEEIEKHLDNLVSKKKFTKYSLLNANKPGHYFGLDHETSFLNEHRVYSDSPIDEQEKYFQIITFVYRKNYEIQTYAFYILLKYFKEMANERTRNWEPIELIIELYKSKGELNQLMNIKEKIKGIPLLYELYKTKIDKTVYKMSKP